MANGVECAHGDGEKAVFVESGLYDRTMRRLSNGDLAKKHLGTNFGHAFANNVRNETRHLHRLKPSEMTPQRTKKLPIIADQTFLI